MLRQARYKCWAWPSEGFPEHNHVLYVVLGDSCYFSGIELERRTSTINAAESVVEAIAKQEGVSVTSLRYFDLQTHRGYYKSPGEYELDELIIREEPRLEQRGGVKEIKVGGEKALLITQDTPGFLVVSWRPTECPAEVLELFREYI